jgi:hypothetical protein
MLKNPLQIVNSEKQTAQLNRSQLRGSRLPVPWDSTGPKGQPLEFTSSYPRYPADPNGSTPRKDTVI